MAVASDVAPREIAVPTTMLAAVAGCVRIAVLLLLVAAGAWAYRRFRLPSVPWLLAYLLLDSVLAVPTEFVVRHLVDRPWAAGGPVGSVMTLGEFLASVSYAEMILGTIARGLVVWFVLSEVAFAYSGSGPAVPAIISLPRRHGPAVGVPLLACVAAVPAFWLALCVARL